VGNRQWGGARALNFRLPIAYCPLPFFPTYCLISFATAKEIPMAKGQMKSNKEKRKPKKDKDDKKGAKK
jgi:hypothetical protein